jgi:hypothetical protein
MTGDRSTLTTADGESTTLASLRAFGRSRLGIDPRALAAFRIGLGLVVLCDLLFLRVPGLATFYTDEGVLPRSALAEASPTLATWSLHALSGSVWLQALLVAIAGGAAACLLVGYRHRLAAVVSALLLASLFARNPYLVNGGDTILLSLLVLAATLPLERRWSLRPRRFADKRSDPIDSRDDPRVVSAATATVLLHVAVIYLLNAVLKFRSDAWMSATAVRRIFHLQDFVFLLGPTAAEYPALLTAVNWLWIAVLSMSPLLVLATGRLRIATVGAFVGAHLGMAATMRLGAFPFVMIAALLLFLPPQLWDPIDEFVSRTASGRRLEALATSRDEGGTGPRDFLGAPRVRRGIRLGTTVLFACVLLSVVSWQVTAAGLVDTGPTPGGEKLGSASWAFFAPDPPDEYSWYVVEAERESGAPIDLVDGGTVDFDRPPDAMDRYPSALWKRYGTKLRGGSGDAHLDPAAAYFCDRAPDDIESVTIYRVDQSVDADGPVGEPVPHERISASC